VVRDRDEVEIGVRIRVADNRLWARGAVTARRVDLQVGAAQHDWRGLVTRATHILPLSWRALVVPPSGRGHGVPPSGRGAPPSW